MHPAADEHKQIGTLFVERGLITEAALENALLEQRRNGGRIGEILVAQGAITRLDLASAIGDQWHRKTAAPKAAPEPAPAPQHETPPAPEPAAEASEADESCAGATRSAS